MTGSYDLQNWFAINLIESLKSEKQCLSSQSYLYEEINSVFKIDKSLNDALVLSINSLISTLCKLPKGIELINTLILDSLRCGFQIVLTKGKLFSSSFPIIKDGKLIIEVTKYLQGYFMTERRINIM